MKLEESVEQNKKLIEGLKEIRNNLRSIDAPNAGDEYIDDSLKIIKQLLEEVGDTDE